MDADNLEQVELEYSTVGFKVKSNEATMCCLLEGGDGWDPEVNPSELNFGNNE